MAKVRVYELAKELGVESKVVMTKLQELGEFVRSASSTVEPPVVRKLREQLNANGGGNGAGAAARAARPAPQAPAARPAPRPGGVRSRDAGVARDAAPGAAPQTPTRPPRCRRHLRLRRRDRFPVSVRGRPGRRRPRRAPRLLRSPGGAGSPARLRRPRGSHRSRGSGSLRAAGCSRTTGRAGRALAPARRSAARSGPGSPPAGPRGP